MQIAEYNVIDVYRYIYILYLFLILYNSLKNLSKILKMFLLLKTISDSYENKGSDFNTITHMQDEDKIKHGSNVKWSGFNPIAY